MEVLTEVFRQKKSLLLALGAYMGPRVLKFAPGG
jgi:hypothetical protein